MPQNSNDLIGEAAAIMAVVQPSNGFTFHFKPLPEGNYIFRAPKANLFSRPEHFLVSEAQREQILAILVPKPRSAIGRRELIAAIVPRNVGLALAVASVIFSLAMLCGGGVYASLMAVRF
jgi:hypothetical protein